MVVSSLGARAGAARVAASLGLLIGTSCTPEQSSQSGTGGLGGEDPGGAGGDAAGAPGNGGSAGATVGSTGGVGGSAPLLDAGADPDNLAPDPSFENHADGWSAWLRHRVERTQEGPRSGAWCLASRVRTEAWMGPALDLATRATPGALYDTSLWVRVSAAASPVSLKLKVLCRLPNDELAGSEFLPVAGPTAATNVWGQLAGTLEVPVCEAPRVLQDLRLVVEGAAAGVDVYVDDVRVVPRAR